MTNDKEQMTKFFRNPWTYILFFLALLPRVFGLGKFLTSDENTNIFFAGSNVVQAFLGGDLRGTYWHFYPGVTMSWADALGFVGQWLAERSLGLSALPLTDFIYGDIRHLLVAQRLPYAILTALFVPLVYWLLRRWLDPTWQHNKSAVSGRRSAPGNEAHWISLLAALFIAFDPFFLAHSRVVHADAPVAVFMVLSTLAIFIYLRDGGWKYLVFSAVTGSLAALTKAPGQFMALFIIIAAAGDWFLAYRRNGRPDWRLAKRRSLDALIWGSAAFITFFILWPSMWVDPIGTLAQMLDETFGKVDAGHLVFFQGQPTLNPGLKFYLYVIPFRLTPITSIGAALSIAALLFCNWQTWNAKRGGGGERGRQNGLRINSSFGKLRTSAAYLPTRSPAHPSASSGQALPTCSLAHLLWFFIIALLIFGNISPKKQDRYLLPLFPMLDILAAIGWYGLWKLIVNYQLSIRNYQLEIINHVSQIAPVFFTLLVALQALIAFNWHPYYLAYFNPLMGGLSGAVETTLVGWGEGMEQVADYLNQKPDAEKLFVASTPSQTLLPYFKGRGENFYTNDVALRADYVVIYRAQQQRLAPSPEIVNDYLAREPEKVIYIKDVPYAWIYANTPIIFGDVPDGAVLTNIGFGGVMRLAAYNLEQNDDSLDVDLFWHALPPIEAARGPCYEERVENFTTIICPRLDYAVSVRVIGPDGAVIAQNDSWPAGGLLPTSQWRVDDYVQDHHTLALSANLPRGAYRVEVVVYESETGDILGGPVEALRFER